MKKIFLIFSLTLLLTGCGSTTKDINNNDLSELSNTIELDETGAQLICTSDVNNVEEAYTVGSKYVIFLNSKNYVTKINSTEIVESNKQEVLNNFESYFNTNYEKILIYGGYTYDVKLENNRLVSNTSINYEEFNLGAFANDYSEIQEYLNSEGKLTSDTLIEYFKSQNITCEKK